MRPHSSNRSRAGRLVFAALALVVVVACGADDDQAAGSGAPEPRTETSASDAGAAAGGSTGAGDASDLPSTGEGVTVRLGYFPNVTHATALVGVEEGRFEEQLGDSGAELQTATFNSGSDTIEQLLAGDLDATYIGPSPTVTAFGQSGGEGVRVIAGVANGGAALVVDESIDSVEDLRGQKVATPDVGNTQDIAARHYFKEKGIETTVEGGGDLSIVPNENATTLQLFGQGEIAGAWLPEPWASRLEIEAGAKRLVDESELWPDGKFITTQLIVRTEFLDEHPDLVQDLLEANLEANTFINDQPDESKQVVSASIEELTGSPISPEVLDAAWEHLSFDYDPIASSLVTGAEHAVDVELGEDVGDLSGLYALELLNGLLAEAGETEVSGP